VSAARPLFIVGNKRSGSTLLVNMLNEHPEVGVTHESDIVWTLFQCQSGVPHEFRCFPLDAPRGMDALLEAFGDSIKELLGAGVNATSIARAFFEIQRQVIERGTSIHVPLKSAEGLLWIGDKKPVQHAFPEINDFVWRHFPDARFIHVIRHPQAAVASKMEAARTWPVVPRYWKAAASQVLQQWCQHEVWVLATKTSHPGRVHTIRLEDICERPREEMAGLFTFLELEMSTELRQRMSAFVYERPNAKYAGFILPESAQAARLMDAYRYIPDAAVLRD
jgi:hypothetical protein